MSERDFSDLDACSPRELFLEAGECDQGCRQCFLACPAFNLDSACVSACSVVGPAVITTTPQPFLGLQPGVLLQHSLAIWSLGHWEIADNLGENGWKIAVFRPLPPAPSFLFSYFLFYFVSFNATKLLQKPRNNMRVWLDFPPPVCDVFCKQTCKLNQNLTSLRQNGERLERGAGLR